MTFQEALQKISDNTQLYGKMLFSMSASDNQPITVCVHAISGNVEYSTYRTNDHYTEDRKWFDCLDDLIEYLETILSTRQMIKIIDTV